MDKGRTGGSWARRSQQSSTASRSVAVAIPSARIGVDAPLALTILFFVSPLMLAVALAVRVESKGLILSRAVYQGPDGRFVIGYTFRTNAVHEAGNRSTRFGSFLRVTGLNRLPLLWNVLVGELPLSIFSD